MAWYLRKMLQLGPVQPNLSISRPRALLEITRFGIGPVGHPHVRSASRGVHSGSVLLLLVLSVLTGCGDGDGIADIDIDLPLNTAIVEVSGTEGKRFRGDYGVSLRPLDSFSSIAVEGTVPATEEIRDTLAAKVRATIRKVDPGAWTLTVCVQIDSQRVCETTTAAFGQVTVTASLP